MVAGVTDMRKGFDGLSARSTRKALLARTLPVGIP